MTQQDDLITTPQAALILGKSHATVLRLARAGELPAAQKLPGPNGAYLYRREEVEAFKRELSTVPR